MAECKCKNCGFDFFQVFPIGHTIDEHLSIGKFNDRFYPVNYEQPWLFNTLIKGNKEVQKKEVHIKKQVFEIYEDVVILNTLDFLYGHVLLKLYNALYHLEHETNIGLIVIIPKAFEWLIPKGCAEAWIVDLKLSELVYGYESIQRFVAQEFNRFDRIYLSKAYSHPDFSKIDITKLTGIPPFNIKTFSSRKPVFTFILREDRWWFPSIIDYIIYRIARKLKSLSGVGRILAHRQNRLVKKTITRIRKQLPEAEFYIAGLGETGNFDGYAHDERTVNVSTEKEIAWCGLYARSHVVIGVHGSNMLLPTAMAAGCVEILPQDRYGNMVQDISVRYNDRRQLFFYRFVDQYASAQSVASKVIGMIRDYPQFEKDMCLHVYS
jgi:glycosyltransferase involved in cell wall biosynthesis